MMAQVLCVEVHQQWHGQYDCQTWLPIFLFYSLKFRLFLFLYTVVGIFSYLEWPLTRPHHSPETIYITKKNWRMGLKVSFSISVSYSTTRLLSSPSSHESPGYFDVIFLFYFCETTRTSGFSRRFFFIDLATKTPISI